MYNPFPIERLQVSDSLFLDHPLESVYTARVELETMMLGVALIISRTSKGLHRACDRD